jgi:hypothetical protein
MTQVPSDPGRASTVRASRASRDGAPDGSGGAGRAGCGGGLHAILDEVPG